MPSTVEQSFPAAAPAASRSASFSLSDSPPQPATVTRTARADAAASAARRRIMSPPISVRLGSQVMTHGDPGKHETPEPHGGVPYQRFAQSPRILRSGKALHAAAVLAVMSILCVACSSGGEGAGD